MPTRAAICLLLVLTAATAAELTWVTSVTMESATPVPGLPPVNTTTSTISGDRMGVRMGDTVTLLDGESVITVNHAKKEYFRASLAGQMGQAAKLQDLMKAMPGYQPPKIRFLPPTEPRPGPELLGVPTTIQDIEMITEMSIANMTMAMSMKMQNTMGKPKGWEAVAAMQAKNAGQTSNVLEQFTALFGGDGLEQLMAKTAEGMPLRTVISTITETLNAPAGAPPMPSIVVAVTTEVISITQTADQSILEIPKDYKEVPAPTMPALPVGLGQN